jgi:hypothetical protein
MNIYRLIKEIQSVLLLNTNSTIPFDPDNTDYQQYQKWLSEGNTPIPADEVTE